MITVTVCLGGEFNHNLLGGWGELGRASAMQKAAPRQLTAECHKNYSEGKWAKQINLPTAAASLPHRFIAADVSIPLLHFHSVLG